MNLLNHLEEQEKKEQEQLANLQISRLKEWVKEINYHKKREAILKEQTNLLLSELGLSEEEQKKIIDKISSQEDIVDVKVSEEEKERIFANIKRTIEYDKLRIQQRNGYKVGRFTFYM